MNFRCFNCNATENLYRAPQSAEMRNYWLDLFPDDGGPEIFTPSFRICAEHFDNKFILANGQLSSKAVPTKFLVHNVWCTISVDYHTDAEVSDDNETIELIEETPNVVFAPERESTEPLASKQDSEKVEMSCVLTSTLFRQQNSLDLLRHLTNLAKQQHIKQNSSIVNDVPNKASNLDIDRLQSEDPAEVEELSSEDEEEDSTVIRLNRSEMVNYYWNNIKFTSCVRILKLFQRDFSENEGSKLDQKIENEIEKLKWQKTELRSKLNAASERLNPLERHAERIEAFISEISKSGLVPEGDEMYEMLQKLMQI